MPFDKKDEFILIDKFKLGWHRRVDPSRIPIGGAQKSVNMTITDRGGIGPRPGELLLGADNTTRAGVKSLYAFKRTDGSEILIKSYSTVLEYYNTLSSSWELLKSGYASGKVFGFKEHTINTDQVDLIYFGNGIDPYARWNGWISQLNGALAGSETEVILDKVLTDTVHESGTASSVTTTTLVVPANTWATDIWNDFYVRITDGAKSGFIARITGTTDTTITFNEISGLSGTPTFELRLLQIPDNVNFTGTASGSSSTTIDVASAVWADDQWNGKYVQITSGAQTGEISLISDGTTTQITFATISGLSGTPTFKIIDTAIANPNSLVYNDATVAYTGVPQDDRVTVASAHAASDGAGVTVAPVEYPENPRGNLFETLHESMYVAGQPSSANLVSRSATADATDYTFQATRAADEGDVIWFPYGGNSISDIRGQESSLYVFKPDAIEAVTYSQDGSDLADIQPITQGPGVGPKGRTWKMGDDIAFGTSDNRISTLGRVKLRDTRPQVTDIAFPIRREVKDYNFDAIVGEEFRNRAFVGVKSDLDVASNDRTMVYNNDNKSWEGYWHLNAGSLSQYNGGMYYGDSFTPNVYQMLTGLNKRKGTDTFPISAQWQSGWINRRGSGFYLNEVSALAVEGYITSGTTINFDLYKDFSEVPFRELSLSGVETDFQDNVPNFNIIGTDALGTEPLGGNSIIGEIDSEGRRHFIIFLYFPITQLEYISIGVNSSGKNQDWETIAMGINATENVFENLPRVKS